MISLARLHQDERAPSIDARRKSDFTAIKLALLAISFILSATAAGRSAEQASAADVERMTRLAAADEIASYNQLGVLEYCKSLGHIDDHAIENQNRLIAFSYGQDSKVAADDKALAERVGRSGIAIVGEAPSYGAESLADIAAKDRGTVAAVCQSMAKTVDQSAAFIFR
ncbi:MAG TPA: hypothetical protein VEJ16_01460 [Alphaproteobacteria bacterium]|nr:hypothetical protein [Alphaproteobacteria bacterium]